MEQVTRRRGFTFIELMVTMTIVGFLASIAVPKYIDLKRRANTTKVIGDFQTVRVAVMSFYADSSYFPVESGAGEVPANLQKYLPIGFEFNTDQWTIDYQNWDAGGQGADESASLIGITVICTEDPALGETTSRVLGNVPQVVQSPNFTFMIAGM